MCRKLTKEEFMNRLYERNEYVRNGDIEIIGEYNGLEHSIEYLCHKCGNIQSPIALSLMNGCGCVECGKVRSAKTQTKSNQKFQDELKKLRESGQDVYTDDEYINRKTKICFYCSHGHTWMATPGDVLCGKGCPYCANRKVLMGYNDIATTSPDIFKYLADPNDGYKYTRWSNVRVDFRCTLCGHVQNRKIASVAHRGFKCECCGNGVSYPNRFGRALFDQLPIKKYRAEYYPTWGKPYVYDIFFKLNGKEYLVEWDGEQHLHKKESFYITLEEQQRIDRIKDQLAAENDVELIRVDCAKSDPDYIKNNILNSELSVLFDLSAIDWVRCDECAQKNLVKISCDLWRSGMRFEEIAERLHLGLWSVRDYINRGTRLGWCDYDPKQWISERCHPVRVINTISGETYSFDSLKECANGSINFCDHRIAEETIRKYSKKGVPYNGLLFEITNSTIQN